MKLFITYLFNSFCKTATHGRNEYLQLRKPSGRPKWEAKITAAAPFSKMKRTVGIAATIR